VNRKTARYGRSYKTVLRGLRHIGITLTATTAIRPMHIPTILEAFIHLKYFLNLRRSRCGMGSAMQLQNTGSQSDPVASRRPFFTSPEVRRFAIRHLGFFTGDPQQDELWNRMAWLSRKRSDRGAEAEPIASRTSQCLYTHGGARSHSSLARRIYNLWFPAQIAVLHMKVAAVFLTAPRDFLQHYSANLAEQTRPFDGHVVVQRLDRPNPAPYRRAGARVHSTRP